MEKKAEAWKQYNQAAIVQQLIEALPQVATAIAQPLAQTDRIVVISTGGDGQSGGAHPKSPAISPTLSPKCRPQSRR